MARRLLWGPNMLRITPLSSNQSVRRLKVEGRLVGEWVEVLEDEVERVRGQTLALELELAGVEFADTEGLTLLHEVAERGAKLVACSPLLTRLLESRGS